MTEAEYVAFIKEETDLDREAEIYSLEHHGVKGQRWGIRRTPAQLGHKESSGRKKKSEGVISKIKKSIKKKKAKKVKVEKSKAQKQEESKEELKKKVLSSSDPKFIYQHMNLLDSKELQDRIDRINKETKIKELANPKKENLYEKADKFLKTTASMAESVTKIYNAYNVVTGKKGGKKDSDKKDQQNKDQQNKDQQNKDQQNKDQQNKDQQNKDQQNKDQQNKGQQNKPSKEKKKKAGIRGMRWGTRKGAENVAEAVSNIMDDPAIKAIFNMPLPEKTAGDWGFAKSIEDMDRRRKNKTGSSNS